MAKRKTIPKNSSAPSAQRSERAAPAYEKNAPPTNTPYIVVIGILLVIIAYLLSGGGSNPPAPGSDQPDTSTFDQATLYTGDIPGPYLKPEFAGFFPDNISGMRRVKLLMDPLNDESGGRFASKIEDSAHVLYLSDSVQTNFEVEYSVYKMESAEAASEVLTYYTTESGWNTLPKQFDGVTFWIWQGFLEGAGRPNGMYFYWDSINDGAFLPIGRQGTSFIAQANADLLCYHGETAQDEYFIMVDVHAPFEKVNGLSDQMFAEAAKQIRSQGSQV
ncbi:MAG: hypothetical protein M8352_04680 [ANME-2 cluster archaeon]|nr:hypothetical protein [ANME-2 cluster archaeon]